MTQAAPSVPRFLRLMVALALRRLLNRFNVLRSRRPTSSRSATARRGPAGRMFFFVFSLALLVNGVIMSTQLVWRLASQAERAHSSGAEIVSPELFTLLEAADREKELPRREQHLRLRLLRAFEQHAWLEEPIGARLEERTYALMDRFDEYGASGFRPGPLAEHTLLPSVRVWFGPRESPEMVVPLSLVALAVSLAVVLLSIGGLSQEMLRIEKTLEWWFTFPIPGRAFFLARVLETAVANPLLWFFVFPLFAATFWCAGYGWVGLPLALVAMGIVGLIAGSVRVAAETALPRVLPRRAISIVQICFLVLGYPLLFFALAGVAPAVVDLVVTSADRLPRWVLVNPFSLPILAVARPGLWLALGGGSALVMVWSSVLLGEWMVRDGLVDSYEVQRGERRPPRTRPVRHRLRGFTLKELLLLSRDRTLLVQSLVVPVVMVGLQAFLNPTVIASARSSPRDAAAIAFGVGSVVLAMGATRVLAVEVPALWLLATLPRPLDRILADKALLWSGIASVFALALFAFIGGANPEFYLRGAPHLVLGLVGLFIYAFIAAGIGIVGTDTMDPEPRRRVQVTMVYLFMLLAALFGYALYTPSEWTKIVQIVLSGLLAVALWQKVRDLAPYVLDPSAAPPRRVAVSDGIIAALCFFVCQGLFVLLLLRQNVSPGVALLVAFTGAGLLVSTATFAALWRAGTPDLVATLGLRVAPGRGLKAILLGAAVGLGATAVGMGYLQLLGQFVPLTELRDEAFELTTDDQAMLLSLATVGVFAAPIFEEFIFRGLLFTGFRRSLSPLRASMASAALFALVHPPVAAVPVFVLALLNALVYERSRTLLAPIVGHMTYNSILIGFQLWPL